MLRGRTKRNASVQRWTRSPSPRQKVPAYKTLGISAQLGVVYCQDWYVLQVCQLGYIELQRFVLRGDLGLQRVLVPHTGGCGPGRRCTAEKEEEFQTLIRFGNTLAPAREQPAEESAAHDHRASPPQQIPNPPVSKCVYILTLKSGSCYAAPPSDN